MSGLGLTFLRRGGQAHPTAGSEYIKFADEEVFRILMSKGVSSDGVGITKDDAAKVESIKGWFSKNATITSFDELKYFNVAELGLNSFENCTSLMSLGIPSSCKSIVAGAISGCSALSNITGMEAVEIIGNAAFRNDSSMFIDLQCDSLLQMQSNYPFQYCGLRSIRSLGSITEIVFQSFAYCDKMLYAIMPDTLTRLQAAAFFNCSALVAIVMQSTNPPTLDANNVFNGTTCPIYVPSASVDAYKTAQYWSIYSSRIKALSELPANEMYNEIKDYIL